MSCTPGGGTSRVYARPAAPSRRRRKWHFVAVVPGPSEDRDPGGRRSPSREAERREPRRRPRPVRGGPTSATMPAIAPPLAFYVAGPGLTACDLSQKKSTRTYAQQPVVSAPLTIHGKVIAGCSNGGVVVLAARHSGRDLPLLGEQPDSRRARRGIRRSWRVGQRHTVKRLTDHGQPTRRGADPRRVPGTIWRCPHGWSCAPRDWPSREAHNGTPASTAKAGRFWKPG